jgi:hypothetical protein
LSRVIGRDVTGWNDDPERIHTDIVNNLKAAGL